MSSQSHNKKGFTLIETLVAIAIIMLSVAGPLVIAQKGIASAVYARDQVIASYLAQDVVEYVRSIRDNNLLGSQPWLTNLGECRDKYCYIDTINGAKTTVEYDSDNTTFPSLNYDGNNYTYMPGGQSTSFRRSVNIVNINTTEAVITVKMNWKTGAFPQRFIIKEHIFDVLAP
ncbi:MAG TPA: type II secretion system protein [Candidatus Paceibacterota bacterium]